MELCISDESSFEGDTESRLAYERKAQVYDPSDFWTSRNRNIQFITAAARAELFATTERQKHSSKDQKDNKITPALPIRHLIKSPEGKTRNKQLFTGWDDDKLANQSNEAIDDFLKRLSPTTTSCKLGPWIWIADQYCSTRSTSDRNLSAFMQAAKIHTNAYLTLKADFENKYSNQSAGSITRKLRPNRLNLESKIKDLALQHDVTNGKWMLFPSIEDVDRTWEIVARATFDGQLGPCAKVATSEAEGEGDGERDNRQRLICIYTRDFSDEGDMSRVLFELQNLKLVNDGAAPQEDDNNAPTAKYYKCDAYTYLDINSGNEYKLKASMYNSKDIFAKAKENVSK